jgi:hypothetical protein
MSLKWLGKQSLDSNEKLFYQCKNCNGIECSHKNFGKGVKFLDHFNECKFKNKDCKICHAVFEILMYHTKKCSKKNCDYPYCKFIKKRYNHVLKKEINSKLEIFKKEIEIQESVYNELGLSLDRIKQNVKDIIELHYPKHNIEVI